MSALRVVLTALFLLAGMPSAMAYDCDAHTSNLEFGKVDLMQTSITDVTTTLNYGCSANPGEKILICVGMGANPASPGAGSYDPRYLRYDSGIPPAYLAFNLYTNPARTDVWGDFGSQSFPPLALVLEFGPNDYYRSAQRPVYGRIDSRGQADLPSGLFNSTSIGNWPMTVRQISFTGPTPPTCNAGGMNGFSRPFYVATTVQSGCRIDVISLLDFGKVFQTIDRNIDSTATIAVTCNRGSSGSGGNYSILLGNGEHAQGQQRRQLGPDGALLKYELYRDAARTQRWGDTGKTGRSGTGNGSPQQWTVYGRVPPQAATTPGTYRDTVLVTVTY